MDSDQKITIAIFGAIAVGFGVTNYRISKTRKSLRIVAKAAHSYMDADLQARVDEIFAEIVENYDE